MNEVLFNQVIEKVTSLDQQQIKNTTLAFLKEFVSDYQECCKVKNIGIDISLFGDILTVPFLTDFDLDDAEYDLYVDMMNVLSSYVYDKQSLKENASQIKAQAEAGTTSAIKAIGTIFPSLIEKLFVVVVGVFAINGKLSHAEKVYLQRTFL